VTTVATATPTDVGYVALSRFEVRPGWEDAVAEAFRDRPGLVDRDPGFVRLEVLRPVAEPTQFWLLTYWADETSFRRWHRSHERRAAHGAIPAGLRLVPGSATLLGFDHVTS
jgi:heme oxygenase (mycobilin-producing)